LAAERECKTPRRAGLRQQPVQIELGVLAAIDGVEFPIAANLRRPPPAQTSGRCDESAEGRERAVASRRGSLLLEALVRAGVKRETTLRADGPRPMPVHRVPPRWSR
jgi:hypothetical protein